MVDGCGCVIVCCLLCKRIRSKKERIRDKVVV